MKYEYKKHVFKFSNMFKNQFYSNQELVQKLPNLYIGYIFAQFMKLASLLMLTFENQFQSLFELNNSEVMHV